MQNPPFYYKVSFHFLAKDKDNEIIHQNWQREFIDPNPYKARKDAFEAFKDYLKFLRDNERLQLDEFKNPKIISPSNIPQNTTRSEDLKKNDENRLHKLIREHFKYVEFEENLDVLIIINDDRLVEEIGGGDSTFTIHSVSSNPLSHLYILDNLRLEFDLYYESKFNPQDYADVIQHFGEGYAKSGEEVGAENYAILPTPMKWATLEYYEKWKNENNKQEENSNLSLWENIIEGGESNTLEFKSSLIYNFIPNAPHHIPRFNNAKTICGFLNGKGGILLIGISDDGVPQGIEEDLKFLGSRDKIKLNIDQLIHSHFGNSIIPLIETSFEKAAEKEFIAIKVQPSSRPVFLKNYNPRTDVTSKHFFARRSASTTEIKDVEEIIGYVFNHWQ